MYLFMKVGPYEGQVRGPFHVDVARQLIATGQAVQAEFREGKFQAPLPPEESEASTESSESTSSIPSTKSTEKPKASR